MNDGILKKIVDEITSELGIVQQNIDNEDSCFVENLNHSIESYENTFDRLKTFVSEYTFASEKEEILFFKETKPQLFCKLIYYQKVCIIETMAPAGSNCAQKLYLEKELENLKSFFDKNIDFYKYYRSGSTYLDHYYFLRGKHNIQMSVESFYFERDPRFSTNCDFKVAKILANELLRIYLNTELLKFERPLYQLHEPIVFPQVKHTWTDSKTALVELIYAIYVKGSFDNGKIDIKELTDYFCKVFNIDVGDAYRTYLNLRIRKESRTLYLDSLIKSLIRKMDDDDNQKR